MTLESLPLDLAALGVTLTVRGDRLALKPPPPPAVLAWLRANKPAVLERWSPRRPPGVPPEVDPEAIEVRFATGRIERRLCPEEAFWEPGVHWWRPVGRVAWCPIPPEDRPPRPLRFPLPQRPADCSGSLPGVWRSATATAGSGSASGPSAPTATTPPPA